MVSLEDRCSRPITRALYRIFGSVVDRALCIDDFNEIHTSIARKVETGDGRGFFEVALDEVGLQYQLPKGDWKQLPESGAAVVVANHPFGFSDALVLGHMLERRRSDFKILANTEVAHILGEADWMIPVDLSGTPDAARCNLQSMRKAFEHLRKGGMLAVFPAGKVAHFVPRGFGVIEGEWKPHLAALIRSSRAVTVPVCFTGKNSWSFHTAGVLNENLRTMLLPRELVKQTRREIQASVGKPISASAAEQFETDDGFMAFLRTRTLMLGEGTNKELDTEVKPETNPVTRNCSSVAQRAFQSEVEDLPQERRLATLGKLSVYFADGCEIPWILKEIGWLREQTFRAVGEGTGKAIDLDRFDNFYEHLFVYNHETTEIVGAYRIARTDVILVTEGLGGMYTQTLFKYGRDFFDAISPALELGRSFIRQEYQRSLGVLPLLWKGIGEYVARNPAYACLFGPVSISQEYSGLSKRMIVDHLRKNHLHEALAGKVNARRRFESVGALRDLPPVAQVARADELSQILSEIEMDGKGMPILLKHYLRLGGQILSFNVDTKFSNALDGLVLVDLRETKPTLLKRYLGGEGYDRFAHYHSIV